MKKKIITKRVTSGNFGCHEYRISGFNDRLKEIDLTVENFVEYWLFIRKNSFITYNPYVFGRNLIRYCHKKDAKIGSTAWRVLNFDTYKKQYNIHDIHTVAMALYADGYLS